MLFHKKNKKFRFIGTLKNNNKKWTSCCQKNHGSFKVAIHTSLSNHLIFLDHSRCRVLKQLMSGKDMAVKANHLVVCCDV